MNFKVQIGAMPPAWVYPAFDAGDIIPLPSIKGELGYGRYGCAVRVSGGWDYAAIGDEIAKDGDHFRVVKSPPDHVTITLDKIDYSQLTEVLPA